MGNHDLPLWQRTIRRILPRRIREPINRYVATWAARHDRRNRHIFQKPNEIVDGISIAAYISAESGVGEAARNMAHAIEAANIDFEFLPLKSGNFDQETGHRWKHKEVERSRFRTLLMHVNADATAQAVRQIPNPTSEFDYVIGYWAWELPEFPDKYLDAFSFVDEVWVMSRFMHEGVSRKSPIPVIRMPPPVHLSEFAGKDRNDYGLPGSAMLFFMAFDCLSFIERKNPFAAVDAFFQAFSDNADAILVIKVQNSSFRPDQYAQLVNRVSRHQNVIIIDRTLSRPEMNDLLSLCDAVISLHRSEGFGLVPAEAMSLGKPAILTNWSGNTDYMTQHNCLPVDYRLVPIPSDIGPYEQGQLWAEPDIEHAAHCLRSIYDDSTLARTIGECARKTISDEFSYHAIGARISQRLSYIRF